MKQVKQVLHRKSEAESAKNLANWQIYPLFLLAASPEITLFLPPCTDTIVLQTYLKNQAFENIVF